MPTDFKCEVALITTSSRLALHPPPSCCVKNAELNLASSTRLTFLPEHNALELKGAYEALGAVATMAETRREETKLPSQHSDALMIAERTTDGGVSAWREDEHPRTRAGVTETFSLAEQACGACKTIGTLARTTRACHRVVPAVEGRCIKLGDG